MTALALSTPTTQMEQRSPWFLSLFKKRISGSGSTGPTHQMTFGLASVFPYKELKEATNNFDSSRVLGEGGYGIVYSGCLRGRTVAIKKLYGNSPGLLEQFLNEVVVLSRIRHDNLVTLHGCSDPHTRELLLIYEFIPNGTVADHLHGQRSVLTWATRIQIAIETAEALAFLHGLEPPVIHRDVKTSNILLDNDFHVKVADLGICRLLPWDTTQVSTRPQGTMGYRDPEYDRLFKLTDKTDVYSFGVVLLELISGKEAVDVNRAPDKIYLDAMAVDMIIHKKLEELVDPKLGYQSDSQVRQMIDSVAELAHQCLLPEGNMRPRMMQVLTDLKEIKDRTQHIHDGNIVLEEDDTEACVFSHEEELCRATNSLNPSHGPECIKDDKQLLEGKDSELGEVDVVGGFSEAYTISHEEPHVATNYFDSSRELETQYLEGKDRELGEDDVVGGFFESYMFSHKELLLAANYFDFSRDLEHDRGRIFHGKLKDGRAVTVKKIPERVIYLSVQLSKEVLVISRLHHENLVTLYGCSAPRGLDMFLVYEYSPHLGTLDFLLHRRVARQPDYRIDLDWRTRINIAVQIAKALSYLHSLEPPIVHGDMTTSNILIDDKFHVKVIGLDIFARFTTLRGVGMRGHMDPEYKESSLDGLITIKNDVYSFGFVLLELILGKQAYDKSANWDKRFLTDIVLNKIQNKELEQLVDVNILYDFHPDARNMADKVSELACRCLQPLGNMRPPMAEVLSALKEIENEGNIYQPWFQTP